MSSSGTQSNAATSTSNPNSQNNGINPTQSSTLYLFTFLATLLLLLAVSCAIVIRSFILRRRFRRRIEEAIAAGVLIPGALDDSTAGGVGRSRRRDFGEKPKLWEVWIDESEHSHGGGHLRRDSLGKNEGKWEDIQPVSAMMVPSGPVTRASSTTEDDMSPPQLGDVTLSMFFARLFRPGPAATVNSARRHSMTEDDTSSASVGSKEQVPEDEQMQVAVLVSMPNPNSPRWEKRNESLKGKARGSDSAGEGEIPDVVFGVASVGYRM